MLQIALIRPGSTDYDVEGRIQGTLDIPLNEQGLADAAQIAEHLRGKGVEMLYAPVSEPARHTAEIVGETLGVKVKKLNKMQNLNHGLWQGMLVDDVQHKQPKSIDNGSNSRRTSARRRAKCSARPKSGSVPR